MDLQEIKKTTVDDFNELAQALEGEIKSNQIQEPSCLSMLRSLRAIRTCRRTLPDFNDPVINEQRVEDGSKSGKARDITGTEEENHHKMCQSYKEDKESMNPTCSNFIYSY